MKQIIKFIKTRYDIFWQWNRSIITEIVKLRRNLKKKISQLLLTSFTDRIRIRSPAQTPQERMLIIFSEACRAAGHQASG